MYAMDQPAQPVEVLLVEDNPGDVYLTREILRRGQIPTRLSVVGDGEEALAFLHRHGRHGDAPRPDLILLDLNLPRLSGREVLAHVRGDPQLADIPVVLLSSSQEDLDVLAETRPTCACCICKPADLDQYHRVAHCIEDFWLAVGKLSRKA
jgi:CheY-like chemotaxis protein